MSTLYLPLRSNAGWFATEDSFGVLDRRLKTLVVTYDRLIVQDGRYELTFWQDGQFFDWMMPAHQIAALDRSGVRFSRPGQPSSLGVAVGGKRTFVPVVGGPIVDFYPLLERAGILRESYIELSDGDLNDSARKREAARARKHARMEEVNQLPGASSAEEQKVLEALYIDATAASVQQVPFCCDSTVGVFADWASQRTRATLGFDPKLAVYARWVSMRLPDFSVASWPDIHKLRESAAGRDFRAVLHRVSHRVAQELPRLQNDDDVQNIIDGEFPREAAATAISATPALQRVPWAVAIDLGLNALGLPTMLSAGVAGPEEAFQILREQRQWISLVHWRPTAGNTRLLNLQDDPRNRNH